MRILGLETSCDETAAAVVEDGRRVLSSVVASQHDLHAEFGGVVPEIASRAHVEKIVPVVELALREAGLQLGETPEVGPIPGPGPIPGAGPIPGPIPGAGLDAIAVGHRPGLIGSLIVGVSAAKALSWSLGLPLIGVDHVRAHLHAPLLYENDTTTEPAEPPTCPALGLVVSGGHTHLYRLASLDDPTPTPIGRTIDDAVGEAYDKAAVILGLPYPGGPNLDAAAQLGDPAACALPRSLLGPESLDFSFSGLKTALLYAVRGKPQGRDAHNRPAYPRSEADLNDQQRRDFAASFQAAVMDALVAKLDRVLSQHPDTRSLIVGGGVSANRELRHRAAAWCARHGLKPHLPPMPYCMDNAAMIAGLAHHRLAQGDQDGLDLLTAANSAIA